MRHAPSKHPWLPTLAVVASLGAAYGTICVAQGAPCQALELVEPGGPRYNALVCQGIASMEHGANKEAIQALEEANTIRFPDMPNFKLFPRLTLLYWRSGDRHKAGENLEKARLSLMILIGVYRCAETPTGFLVLTPRGDRVEGTRVEEIRRRMCGAAYEAYYGYNDGPFNDELLERIAADARLVENYLRVAKAIAEHKSGDP